MTTEWPKVTERDNYHHDRVTRTKVSKYECGNCGRWHIGYYDFYYPPMDSGYEVDFIWTDWAANERMCAAGKHRRDPCTLRCWRCEMAS